MDSALPLSPRRGAHLDFLVRENARTSNGLWSDDEVELSVDGAPAGWIRLTHIPSSRMNEDPYRGILDWLRMKGYHLELDADPLPRIRRHVGLPADASPRRVRSALERMWGREWREFRRFHVDRPYVAYACLSNGREPSADACGRPVACFRRLGLAPVLYAQAAIWLGTRGFLLHASDLRSSEAEKVWTRLSAMHPDAVSWEDVGSSDCGRRRPRLDGTRLGPIVLPDWGGTMEVRIQSGPPVVREMPTPLVRRCGQ